MQPLCCRLFGVRRESAITARRTAWCKPAEVSNPRRAYTTPFAGISPHFHHHPEADGFRGRIRRVAAACRTAAVDRQHPITTAANDAELPALWPWRIVGRALEVVILIEPVVHPFLYVAVHVVEAKSVGEELRHRAGGFAGQFVAGGGEERIPSREFVAAREVRGGAGAAGVFPLRFGREAVGAAMDLLVRHPRELIAKTERLVPCQVLDWMFGPAAVVAVEPAGVLSLDRFVLRLRDRHHGQIERPRNLHLVNRPFKRPAGSIVAHAEGPGRDTDESHTNRVLHEPNRSADGGRSRATGCEWFASGGCKQSSGTHGRCFGVEILSTCRGDRRVRCGSLGLERDELGAIHRGWIGGRNRDGGQALDKRRGILWPLIGSCAEEIGRAHV